MRVTLKTTFGDFIGISLVDAVIKAYTHYFNKDEATEAEAFKWYWTSDTIGPGYIECDEAA